VSEEDIKAHVLSYSEKGVISKFAVPQKILFVEALAKTSVGKFDKKARCAPNTVTTRDHWQAAEFSTSRRV
jgi:acyl-CoA synthetase (AMP-forming)/AMP-acid ligase II